MIYYNHGKRILYENICKELEEKKGGKLETSDFSSKTEYDEIRIIIGCHLESGKTELSWSDVWSAVPVKNGDMTGKVITNTDGRITAVRQYLGKETPELLSLISDYTVSGDAEQVGDDTESQYSKVTVKLSQPVSLDMLYDMSEGSELYNSVCKFLDGTGTDAENAAITEFAFTVSTYEGKNYIYPETAVPTFSVK